MVNHSPSTINEARLEPGQFLVLHIGNSKEERTVSNDSIRTKSSQYWFFEVSDAAEIRRQSLSARDSTGAAAGPVAADSGLDYRRLVDSSGSDILRNDDDNWRVYHYSIGAKQNDLRLYPRVPENQNGGGFTYLSGSQPDPTSGEDFGFVESNETGYNDPSIKLESLAWNEGVLSEQQVGFYNTAPVAQDPIISVVGAAYDLLPVVERDAMYNLLADVGRPIDQQQNRVHLVDFSKTTLRTFSYEVPEEWKDAQNTLTVKSANLPEELEKVASAMVNGDGQSQMEQNSMPGGSQ